MKRACFVQIFLDMFSRFSFSFAIFSSQKNQKRAKEMLLLFLSIQMVEFVLFSYFKISFLKQSFDASF